MKNLTSFIDVQGVIGKCGGRDVFLGFAPAQTLYEASFADVLDEETGVGYQRPRDRAHSLDFKRYISHPDSSTVPLTFNLRVELKEFWSVSAMNGQATLRLKKDTRCLAQVDCQHRLGELKDEGVSLAFMAFIGLDLRNEMAMFTIINSKSRGLSSSLTDYHRSNLLDDLVADAPELFIARRLNEDPRSPWFRLIRYGGESTSGLKRRTSLRMMQKAIHRLIHQTRFLEMNSPSDLLNLLVDYWDAVAKVFANEWGDPRHSLVTKGVGLYALTQLLGTIISKFEGQQMNKDFFVRLLMPLATQIDWGAHGSFAGSGGQKGAAEAHAALRKVLSL